MLIVGAGIVGASLARSLTLRGTRVLVLEADVAGRGATGRNAGFLLAEGSETTSEVMLVLAMRRDSRRR